LNALRGPFTTLPEPDQVSVSSPVRVRADAARNAAGAASRLSAAEAAAAVTTMRWRGIITQLPV